MSNLSVSPDQLSQELARQPGQWFLVDVRSPGEFRSGHIKGAQNTPVDTFTVDVARAVAQQAGERQVCLICQSGKRSQRALGTWQEAGLDGAVELAGGMNDWPRDAVVKEANAPISIQRQVQITAGLLTFVGTLLGATVSGGFYLIPGVIGAGFIFAGTTGTCGMALMLTKMPWNH
ncbi:MAG: rhodanese-like domain-containing protein [Puniceicoccales bacterium]